MPEDSKPVTRPTSPKLALLLSSIDTEVESLRKITGEISAISGGSRSRDDPPAPAPPDPDQPRTSPAAVEDEPHAQADTSEKESRTTMDTTPDDPSAIPETREPDAENPPMSATLFLRSPILPQSAQDELLSLRRKNRELEQANHILRVASQYYASQCHPRIRDDASEE